MSTPRWADSSEYRAELRSDVESAIKDHITPEDLNDKDWRNNECFIEALDSAAETTCIYYSVQREIMRFTDNEDALLDIEGPTIRVESFGDAVSKFAYYAYRQDLFEMLNNMDNDEVAALLGATQCTSCEEYGEWDGEICDVCSENEEDTNDENSETSIEEE